MRTSRAAKPRLAVDFEGVCALVELRLDGAAAAEHAGALGAAAVEAPQRDGAAAGADLRRSGASGAHACSETARDRGGNGGRLAACVAAHSARLGRLLDAEAPEGDVSAPGGATAA